jgi:RNA polymerase sigma factor (sigma-70 family)
MTRGSRLQPLARAVLRTQSDERLVALSRDGREAAFEEIVRRYRPGLVAFAAAYAPLAQAEDVVQESLVSSWDALRRSTEEIRLKPWLYTIVRNRALNARRDTRAHGPLTDDLDGVRRPDEVVLTNEELGRVVAAVGALPEAQREALVRSAVEGHTHEQIATALGSSPGAVRQLIYRGRLAVRSGVGLVIPLPLVRALADTGAGEAAATAVAGGAVAAGAGGASGLTKATVVAVVGTIAIGSGAAIKRSADERGEAASSARSNSAEPTGSSAGGGGEGAATVGQSGGSSGGGQAPADGEDRQGSDDEPRRDEDDRHGRGHDSGDHDGNADREGDDDHGDSSGPSDDDVPSSAGGHGSDDDDPPTNDDDDSGSGHSGSGSHSGSGGSGPSGSSGSGGADSGEEDAPDAEVEVEEPDDDSSGSGSSESGSSGSGSSGSGSGSDSDDDHLDAPRIASG